jgi:uncharacterized protein
MKDPDMKCPTCADSVLMITDRQGVEIDYCQQCRGVWLDRGELDKLMDRAAAAMPGPAPTSVSRQQSVGERRTDFVDSDHGGMGNHGAYRTRRKKSWLNEIFD